MQPPVLCLGRPQTHRGKDHAIQHCPGAAAGAQDSHGRQLHRGCCPPGQGRCRGVTPGSDTQVPVVQVLPHDPRCSVALRSNHAPCGLCLQDSRRCSCSPLQRPAQVLVSVLPCSRAQPQLCGLQLQCMRIAERTKAQGAHRRLSNKQKAARGSTGRLHSCVPWTTLPYSAVCWLGEPSAEVVLA